jgi:hypothetical protein
MASVDIRAGNPYPFLTRRQLFIIRNIKEKSGIRLGRSFLYNNKRKIFTD